MTCRFERMKARKGKAMAEQYEKKVKLTPEEIAEREEQLVKVVKEEEAAEAAAKESSAHHRERLKEIRTRKRKLAEEAATGETSQFVDHDPRQADLFDGEEIPERSAPKRGKGKKAEAMQ